MAIYVLIWNIFLTVLYLNDNCLPFDPCPHTPCYCTNTTADCSNRKLQTLKDLEHQLPENTQVLILSGNNFVNIENNFFQPIASLKVVELHLSNCSLQRISEEALHILGSMKVLDISKNNFTCDNIKIVIKQLKKLQIHSLDISDVRESFSTLPNEIFEGVGKNCSLQEVHIRKWNLVEVKGETFKGLRNLHTLDLSYNKITQINMLGLENLKNLDLSRNNLTYEHILEVLKSLNGSQIQSLDISDVKDTPPLLLEPIFNSWKGNCSLQTLRLRKWNLVNVNGEVFKNLIHLQTLDLSNNKIMRVSMKGLQIVRNVNLTYNELSSVPAMCDLKNRSFVPNLEKLYLAINHISDSSQFRTEGHCLTALMHLNLSFNAISILKSYAFSTIINLKTLRLDNMLTYELIIEENAFRLTSLTELSLGSNKRITKEMLHYENIFKNTPNLTTLDMSNFDFSTFSDEDFRIMLSQLLNLENLNLRHCLFNSVPDISHLYNLTSLNLDGNFIRHIHKDAFQNNLNLKEIILRKNQLTSIREDSFTENIWKNPNFSIDVSFNPFACDCDLEWFIKWADANKKKIRKYDDDQCDSPKEWKGIQISENVHILETGCHSMNRTVIIAVTIGSFVFIFLFIFVLVRKFKWDILYHLHNCTNRRHGYQRLADKPRKEYDAFVAYNTHDRKWIMSELVNTLEKREGYKLCLRERNILPLGSHVDNIYESIEASQNLILVLSNNFMEDQWCQFETIIANHKLADGNKDRIFLILLNDIDTDYFTIALKILLKEVKSVEWTTNVNGRKLFWKKLKSFMSK